MKYIPHISLPFLASLFISLSASAETYYYWGDGDGGNMPVFGASAWSSSSSEYVAIPEDTNVNSPDAKWVFDYDAHLPVAHRSEGIYFNIIDQPSIDIASLSVINYNYNNTDYISGGSAVAGGNARTLFISNTDNAYWNIGEFKFTGGSSYNILAFGSARVNSNQPEVTLGTVNIGSEGAYANIQFGGDAAGVCKMTAGDVTTVMSVKMAGIDGKKQIIHADAQFSGTVEVESGALIMKSTTALGKLTMTGGAFGGIDGGVTVSGADWYGGDIILYGADALNSGIADKITVDGKLSKLGDGPIGVDFNGYEVSSDYIDNEEMFYELLTATEREGFSDDANEDFYAKNLENCFAKFEWVGDTLTVSFASVPEPAEIGALIGLLTLAIAARRKR